MDLHVALDGREELVPMSTEATGGALRNHVAVVFRLLRDTFEMRTQRSDGVHCIEDDAKLRSCLEVPSVTLVPNVRSAARTLLEDHHSILPDEYDTALQDALLTDKDLTLLLLEAGADPNPPFESLLERAVLAKDVWAVTTLLQHGAEPNPSRTWYLAGPVAAGDVEVVRALLAGGCHATHGGNRTLLHIAAAADQVESLRLLLRYGGDVTQRCFMGTTALHSCMSQACMRLLVDAGASVTQRDYRGRDPLRLFLDGSFLEVVCGTEHFKTCVEAEDDLGHTPLQTCVLHASQGDVAKAEYGKKLIAAGVSPTRGLEMVASMYPAYAREIHDVRLGDSERAKLLILLLGDLTL